MASELVYFVPIRGRAQVRYGTSQFIGCRRDRDSGRLVWNLDEPTGIGEAEHRRYRRDYAAAVRRGDLQRVSVEPLPGGGTKVVVLPGSPPVGAKSAHRAAGSSWVVGGPPQPEEPRAAAPVDAAAQDGSESIESASRRARR